MKKLRFFIPVFCFFILVNPFDAFAQNNCAQANPVNVNTDYGGAFADNFINNPVPTCVTIEREIWVEFTAISPTATVTINPNSTRFNPTLTAYSGPCNALVEIGCVDANGNNGAETLNLTGLINGNTYYIRIGNVRDLGISSNRFGIFRISTPIPNDLCINATTLNCGDTNILNTTYGTTNNTNGTGCTMSNNGVWYTFVGDGNQTTIITSSDVNSDHEMAIVSGSCGSFTNITCEDDTGTEGVEAYTFDTVIGTNYYVYVSYYFPSSTNYINFYISRTCVTTCNLTTSLEHTDLACPSVIASDVAGNNPASLDYCTGDTSIDLEANYLDIGDTSSYTVTDISGTAPPFNYGCLANQVSVDQDDVFSPTVNLPFTFCFYGQTYSSCTIGSNGVISFNTGLANGPSGWEINNNIPSNINATSYANLFGFPITLNYNFGPSIFGAHNDIDPRYGGEVGWELITLDTGCRALVAAWNEVPLFLNAAIGDLSKRYTSMIVLYENTNVIEIYIKEKVLDDINPNTNQIWNNGRATIGLQNATSNAATAPPSRNNINTTWTATDEAWRFVPSGGSLVTLNWYEGSGTTGTNLGSANPITVNPAGTTTYTAAVTYNYCNDPANPVTITNEVTVNTEGKRWNGGDTTIGPNTTSDDWNNPENWLGNTIPTINDCVFIPTAASDPNPVIYDDDAGYGLNLIMQTGTTLTLEGDTNPTNPQPFNANPTAATLTLQQNINTNGTITMGDDSSLVQIDNTTNTGSGSINIVRNSAPVISSDYVYWASPIENFNLSGIPGNATYQWLPTQANGTAGEHGNWIGASGGMVIGKGYIKRSGSTNANGVTASFNGIITNLNNGNLTTNIASGTWNSGSYQGLGTNTLSNNEDDNFNLIGNPYPSAINARTFLAANTNIEGNVRIWTHGTPISATGTDQFYEDYANNYSVSDYIVYNASGPTQQDSFHGNIASGQGFFVLMNHGETPNPGNVVFTNDMRYSGNSPYSHYGNNQFYKNGNSKLEENEEAHRIWFSLVSPNNEVYNILIGYIEGATDGKDRMYDANSTDYNAMNLYSLLDGERMVIQGRALPFQIEDQVPMGVITTVSGMHTIGINSVDGLFLNENQDIYLEDTELNIIHDLRANPYTFMVEPGRHDRFILRYTNNSLGIENISSNHGFTIIAPNNNYIKVTSENQNIQNVILYDLLGRVIMNQNKINATEYILNKTNLSSGVYLVKATLINGSEKIKKVVLK